MNYGCRQIPPSPHTIDNIEQNHLPDNDGFWSHTVDFHVAPKGKGIYSEQRLQTLMMLLVPRVKPSQKDAFFDAGDALRSGKLYFDEQIGIEEVHSMITLTDPDVPKSQVFVEGKLTRHRTKKIMCRVWVSLFPDTEIATEAIEEDSRLRFMISHIELRKRST